MREVLPELAAARERGAATAMATVVRTWRSAPRPAGASMLVTDTGVDNLTRPWVPADVDTLLALVNGR